MFDTLKFDLKVTDFGTNTNGMVVKIECSFPCGSGDYAIATPTVNEWTSYSIPLQNFVDNATATDDFSLTKINTPIAIFPAWGDQDGATFRIDNIRFERSTSNWTLLWSDEFNGTSIDTNHWEHEVNCWGGGNDELQCYTDRAENSFQSQVASRPRHMACYLDVAN